MHCGRFHLPSIAQIGKQRETDRGRESETETERESFLVSDGAMPKTEISLCKVRNLCNNSLYCSVHFEIFYGIYQHKMRASVLQQCM